MRMFDASLGVAASWAAGFVAFLLVADGYRARYYPGEEDPVHFDIAASGLAAGAAVGLLGTAAVVAWPLVGGRRRPSSPRRPSGRQ